MAKHVRLVAGKYAGSIWGLASWLVIFALWTQSPFSDLLHRVEYVLYDLRMKRRGVPKTSGGSQVVVVSIGEDDVERFGKLPWPRTRYADLIRHLAKGGARAIVVDIFFPDATDEKADQALASAIQEAGMVFLPKFSLRSWDTGKTPADGVYRGKLSQNYPLIYDHAAGTGHINVLVDPDGIVRRMPARIGAEDERSEDLQVPVGFLAVLRAFGEKNPAITATPTMLRGGALEIPLDEYASIPINYLDFKREVYFRHRYAPDWVEAERRTKPIMICSYLEAMGLASAMGDALPPVDLQGKVVVVAGTVQGSGADMHSTPFARQYGALIHAAFIHSLLERQFVRIPRQSVLFGILLALSLPLGVVAFRIRLRGSSYTTVAGMVLTLVGLLTALGLLSWVTYNYWGVMFQVTPFALMLVLHFGAALAASLSRAARETEQTRRAAEEALRESEAHLKTVLDSVRAGIVVVDPETQKIIDANSFAAEMLGCAREELIGQPCRGSICQIGPGQCPICDLKRPEHSSETILHRPNDGQLFVLKTATLVERKGRQYIIESFIDISNRKRAEEELRESNRRLVEALEELETTQRQVVQQERLRALGEMASGIAHDFNNALMPVVGYSDMLLTSPEILDDREQTLRFLGNVRTAAEDARQVVKRLREFYRHRDEDDLLLQTDLNEIINEALALTQPKWKEQAQASGKTITIETDLGKLPSTLGNETELREMLTNLIFNAVDAMPEPGTLRVHTRLDGEHIVIEVSDTGIGMDEETQRRCLEPFFTTKGERGTGLGLAITYGIIQRHQGTVEIDSRVGEGTTFTIRLPVRAEQGAVTRAPAPAAAAVGPLRVLVVDDDPEALQVIVTFLQADSHTAETASDGLEALEKFSASQFDLVVTDMAMPGLSGDQLATKVKERAPQTRVILVTGFTRLLHDASTKRDGVDLILGKPVTLAAFRQALAEVAGTRLAAAGPPPP